MAESEPTIRDVLAKIDGMEASLRGDMRAMEARLTRQIAAVKDELKAEIGEAYDLHHVRIVQLEAAVRA